MKNCPKCKTKITSDNQLCIQQKFTATFFGYQDENGNQDMDIEAGYTLLDEWLDNMLSEDGKTQIIGCQNCIN